MRLINQMSTHQIINPDKTHLPHNLFNKTWSNNLQLKFKLKLKLRLQLKLIRVWQENLNQLLIKVSKAAAIVMVFQHIKWLKRNKVNKLKETQ